MSFFFIMENICQSCGMPLKKEEDYGTNIDGTKNKDYCHFCFKDGKFTDEGITMEEKIDKLVEIAVDKLNMTEEKARELAEKLLPRLKRWQK